MILESGIRERPHLRHVFRLRLPFPIPRPLLGSVRSSIFFPFDPVFYLFPPTAYQEERRASARRVPTAKLGPRLKMALKISSVVKQLLCVLKLLRITSGNIHSFRIRSKETIQIMYPKYPVLDMIQRIHLRWGSLGSIIHFGF